VSKVVRVTVHPGVGPGDYTASLSGGCAHVRAGSRVAGSELPVLDFRHNEALLDSLCCGLQGVWAGSPSDLPLVRDIAKTYALQMLHKHLRDRA
jgi:hypothetical protein